MTVDVGGFNDIQVGVGPVEPHVLVIYGDPIGPVNVGPAWNQGCDVGAIHPGPHDTWVRRRPVRPEEIAMKSK